MSAYHWLVSLESPNVAHSIRIAPIKISPAAKKSGLCRRIFQCIKTDNARAAEFSLHPFPLPKATSGCATFAQLDQRFSILIFGYVWPCAQVVLSRLRSAIDEYYAPDP